MTAWENKTAAGFALRGREIQFKISGNRRIPRRKNDTSIIAGVVGLSNHHFGMLLSLKMTVVYHRGFSRVKVENENSFNDPTLRLLATKEAKATNYEQLQSADTFRSS